MKRFIAKYADKITGVLSGFDRLVFRGTIRRICYVEGLKGLLFNHGVLLKDFGTWAQQMSGRIKESSCRQAEALGRPVEYLPSSKTRKEEVARAIADRDRVREGLIAVLSCVEPCVSYDIFRNRQIKRLELVRRPRKGLALYHYFIDPVFGFMYARIQTWLPFGIQIGINGREWLSRMMDKHGLAYRRRENCFTRLADVARAQSLMDSQLTISWPRNLNRIAQAINPAHTKIFRGFPADYYWSVHQSEWATDIMFKNNAALSDIYPALIEHGITTFSSGDVMRFLGGKVHGAFKGEIVSDFKDRPEGVRIKHRIGQNSIKLYDKESILRAETTINDPSAMKVFRRSQTEQASQPPAWRPMRKGIADLHRRAQCSQAANERYLDALASVNVSTPIGDLVKDICRPALFNGKRVRALRPWSVEETRLFRSVSRGEFAVGGFRNRDLVGLLYDSPSDSPNEQRRRSARVSRLLRMLRAHSLIKKVHATHRYVLTSRGSDIIHVVLATQHATLEQIKSLAA